MPTYSQLRQRYRQLPTEELLRLAAADLTPEARLALDAELESRADELDDDPPELHSEPPTEGWRRFPNLWVWCAMGLLAFLFPILLPYWRKLLSWLTE